MNPQNQTNPESFPENPPPTSQGISPLPATQPSSQKKPKSKKHTLLFWIIGIVSFIIVVAPAIYFIAFFSVIANTSSEKMKPLNENALLLENELNSLVILNDEPVKAEGKVNGDGLTASADPKISTYAQANLKGGKTLSAIETEVNTNLSKAGYSREGGAENPNYSTIDNYSASIYSRTAESVVMRYIKEDVAIKVTYKFDKNYGCPTGYVCQSMPDQEATSSKIYHVSGFGSVPVTNLTVILGDKSMSNMTTYKY